MSPSTVSHSSHTTQQMSVAPKITRTSPGWMAPDTIWSHRASMVPPVMTASLPGSVPAAWPIGTTVGICASDTPMRRQQLGVPAPVGVEQAERRGDAGVDRPAVPEMAWVATAWQGQ